MTKRIDPMIPVNKEIHVKLIVDGWTLIGRNHAATRSSEYRRLHQKARYLALGAEPSFVKVKNA